MQKVVSLLQSAKLASIENIDLEISRIKEALQLIENSDIDTDVIMKLSANLECCIANLNGIEISIMRNQYDMIEYEAYNELLDECIELANAQIHPIIKDIPSNLIFKLLKTSVDHVNRLETGYAHFDQKTLNEMFVESVQTIIEEMAQKSQIMAEFIAEDYTANQKAEKCGRD